MAEKAEVAVFARSAGVLFFVHGFLADFGDVGIEDFEAVEVDGDFVAIEFDLFIVPLADGAKVPPQRGREAVETAVDLVGMEPAFVFVVAVIKDLAFHSLVGDFFISDGRAERQSVVAAGRKLEFQAGNKMRPPDEQLFVGRWFIFAVTYKIIAG